MGELTDRLARITLQMKAERAPSTALQKYRRTDVDGSSPPRHAREVITGSNAAWICLAMQLPSMRSPARFQSLHNCRTSHPSQARVLELFASGQTVSPGQHPRVRVPRLRVRTDPQNTIRAPLAASVNSGRPGQLRIERPDRSSGIADGTSTRWGNLSTWTSQMLRRKRGLTDLVFPQEGEGSLSIAAESSSHGSTAKRSPQRTSLQRGRIEAFNSRQNADCLRLQRSLQ